MALGTQKTQQRFDNPRDLLGDRLKEGSLYRLLADHGDEMFPDDYFADLYSVPPGTWLRLDGSGANFQLIGNGSQDVAEKCHFIALAGARSTDLRVAP